jgi:hypothetical protein
MLPQEQPNLYRGRVTKEPRGTRTGRSPKQTLSEEQPELHQGQATKNPLRRRPNRNAARRARRARKARKASEARKARKAREARTARNIRRDQEGKRGEEHNSLKSPGSVAVGCTSSVTGNSCADKTPNFPELASIRLVWCPVIMSVA